MLHLIVPVLIATTPTTTLPAVSPETRCGHLPTQEDVQIMRDRENEGVYEPSGGVAGVVPYVIPITVHVLRQDNGQAPWDSGAAVEFIDEANLEFAGSGLTFAQLGPVRFLDNSDFFGSLSVTGLWLANNVADTVNVYYGAGYGFCGVSAVTSFDGDRGVLLNDICDFGEPLDASVLSHELGHYFDLFHTHEVAFGFECPDGSNCAGSGDLVCDTPADPDLLTVVNDECDYVGEAVAPCGEAYVPDTKNLMSHARQHCINMFSAGQVDRMRASLENIQPEVGLAMLPEHEFTPAPGHVRASVSSAGQSANTNCFEAVVSANGRFIAFRSLSGELVASDSNFQTDVFRHDRETGETIRVSVNSFGVETDSRADEQSISADGRFVAFSSFGSNLHPDNPGDFRRQIYVRDIEAGRTTPVSRTSDGVWGNSQSLFPMVSDDGRTVVFFSQASNLAPDDAGFWGDFYKKSLVTGSIEVINIGQDGQQSNSFIQSDAAMTPDARYVAFSTHAALDPIDTNNALDIYLRDTVDGVTELISIATDGTVSNDSSLLPSISADARYVVFETAATNLFESDLNGSSNDVVIRDRLLGSTTRVNVSSAGIQGNSAAYRGTITRDGRYVAFVSQASNLAAQDTTSALNVFRHDTQTGHTVLISRHTNELALADDTETFEVTLGISGDGQLVTFTSAAPTFLPHDYNSAVDVFTVDVGEVLRSDGDIDADGIVGVDDLIAVILAWGACPDACASPCPADLDGDCAVTVDDLVAVILGWS